MTRDEYNRRLWRRVDVRTPDECWPWMGCTVGRGYGQLRWAGQQVTASRVAFAVANGGNLPGRKTLVCHRCDNPICCNPSHLFPGTHKDNYDDMWRKGRSKWRSIRPDEIEKIRALFRGDRQYGDVARLARELGLLPGTVYNIGSGHRRPVQEGSCV